ncbi:Carboxypeptidase S [Madurella fahalii]|uniref:Carboxypeptidase S n=1 Tax=Madurella fahalii TaxID=1157608 RepID=A0ABQ0GL93_9PEZI
MKSTAAPALPLTATPLHGSRKASRKRCFALLVIVLQLLLILFLVTPNVAPLAFLDDVIPRPLLGQEADFRSGCPQSDSLFPPKEPVLDKLYDRISGAAFRNASIARLSGAVRVKTESFDDLGPVGEDPRWDVFYDFYQYLEMTFPLIHKKLLVEKVNTYGLLYTWKGDDESLKPTLLMAHQDTVPVPPETVDSWTYPPWSGAYDGKYIWGRGASDCKNQLIALMETLELLLEADFKPKRTILLSFGFDEECSGTRGAARLAAFIEERYGKDGIAAIVDEGSGLEETWGTLFAKPGTAEKGATDVYITVRAPGGHSSIPPDHTSIGILSELITKIEAEQYQTLLVDENPYYTQLQCGAAYSPEFPSKLKKLLARRGSSALRGTCKAKPDYLAIEAAKQGPDIKYLMQTSQAVDVISGGVKINALPERASVIVDHRINVGETRQVVRDRLTSVAGAVAKKYNLTLHAFDGKEEPSSIMLEHSTHELEVAPVTPADASVEGPFAVLAGTVRALYGQDIIVTPGIMTGNTDTRYYWDLSRHIFRFAPGFDPEDGLGWEGIHTVDERVSVTNHINSVKWFMLFVRNMDEANL